MQLEPVYQEAQALVVGLLRGNLPLSLTVLRQRVLTYEDWQFQFTIIGESHWIQISHPQHPPLQEVLACIPLSPDDCWHYHAFTDLAPYCLDLGFYRFEMWATETPVTTVSYPHQMCLAFPPTLGVVPVTELQWQQQNARVVWKTLHTYPTLKGMIYVHTKSHINFDEIDTRKDNLT